MSEPIIDSVHGFRVFEVVGDELHSLTDYVWEPGWNEAECRTRRTHRAPARGCSCGFWVYRTFDRAYRQFGGDLGVGAPSPTPYGDFDGPTGYALGRVQIAGRTVTGADGWRTERAGILALYADPDEWGLLGPVVETYGLTLEPLPDPPVEGLLAHADDQTLTVMIIEGDRKYTVEAFRFEHGSAAHLDATFLLGHAVRVGYQTQDDGRWVTELEDLDRGRAND